MSYDVFQSRTADLNIIDQCNIIFNHCCAMTFEEFINRFDE